MFSDKTETPAILPIAVLVVLLLVTIAAVAPAVAQAQTQDQVEQVANQTNQTATQDQQQDQSTNETETTRESIIYQFEDGSELVDVTFDGANNTAFVTLRAGDGPTRFSLAEGQLDGSGSFAFKQVRVLPGQEKTVEIQARQKAIVITTQNEGYLYEDSQITIITGKPTGELMQLSATSGVIGSLTALGIVVGQLKRRHENSYKELFSDETHRIESDPVTGVYEWIIQALKNSAKSKYRVALGAGLFAYSVAALTGMVMSPFGIWGAMSDSQRLIAAGSAATTVVAIMPVYMLVKRIWNPNREFVLDLDSRDVYKAENGDKSGSVGVYSAPPSRISEMEVDGSLTTVSTPGGRCHLVRGFDPSMNTAEANPPELADDRSVSIEIQKIDHNRKILTDLASIGRDLIGAMSAFRVTADAAAMKDIDNGLRNTVSAGPDSLEDVLSDAVAGTRYEGTYQPDTAVDEAIGGTDDAIEDDEPNMDPSEASKNGVDQ